MKTSLGNVGKTLKVIGLLLRLGLLPLAGSLTGCVVDRDHREHDRDERREEHREHEEHER